MNEIGQEVFKRQTGSAPNFQSIDGVGPKTAEKLKGTIVDGKGRIQAPSDVSDLTDDRLAKEAGISQSRARKVIRGGGGNPDRSPRSTTGSVSAAGIRLPTGEFKTEVGDKDKAEAKVETSLNRGIGRSQNAAIADKSKRAPITTDYDRWKDNKGELDYPGADTPTDSPEVLPKDLKQEQRPATTDPDFQEQRLGQDSVNAAQEGTGKFILEDEIEAGVNDLDIIGEFVQGPIGERDLSLSRSEAIGIEGRESAVSFAGPEFDRSRGRTRETDRREREQEMGIVPEDAFMQASGGNNDDDDFFGGERM